MITLKSDSAEETYAFGKKLGAVLAPGDIVFLNGDLGAGKTCITSGICSGADITDPVSSPTFAIMNEYRGNKFSICHVDAYRLTCQDDLDDVGFWDVSQGEAAVIEWSDLVYPERKENGLYIDILRQDETGPESRIIKISGCGERGIELEQSFN